MLNRSIQPPKPVRIESIEDIKKWIEAWNEFFERIYKDIVRQFEQFDKISVRGDDNQEIHGFFSQPTDMKP